METLLTVLEALLKRATVTSIVFTGLAILSALLIASVASVPVGPINLLTVGSTVTILLASHEGAVRVARWVERQECKRIYNQNEQLMGYHMQLKSDLSQIGVTFDQSTGKPMLMLPAPSTSEPK